MKYKILIAFILFSPGLFAQNKLAKQLFKKYIGVCNAYKQLPLHLEIEYKKTSNMALYNDDSTTMQGVFYIQKKGAFAPFFRPTACLLGPAVFRPPAVELG